MSHKPAGGIKSRVNVSPKYREGSPRERVRVAGVNQRLGAKVGDHVTGKGSTGYTGEVLFPGGPAYQSRLGNTVAKNTVCGPGGSRTVMRSGQQATHGTPAYGDPMPVSKGDLTKLDWKR